VRADGTDPDQGTPDDRGLIANPILRRQAVRGVYFFAGDWRKAAPATLSGPWYEGKGLGDNTAMYTIYPSDSRHLGWSETQADRDFAVDEIRRANANTVVMSSWGRARTDDRWAFWAPMHTAPAAHDQLFDEAVSHGMLVIPAIESGRCTQGLFMGWDGNPGHVKLPGAWPGTSGSFYFASEFPRFNGTDNHSPDPAVVEKAKRLEVSDPAPPFVAQVEDLLERYVVGPSNPQWRERWARIYDRTGTPRYAINVIQVASNQIDPGEHARFAAGFTAVATKVRADLHVNVGFTLDIVPVDHAGGRLHATDQACGRDSPVLWRDTFNAAPDRLGTGPLLASTDAVLAVQAFIPEIWSGLVETGDEPSLRDWKAAFIRNWVGSGVPVFLDVDPGYSTHEAFDASRPLARGWGWNDDWFNFQSEMKATGVRGIVFNTWNGYTEGYAGMPVDGVAGPADANARIVGRNVRSASDWLTHLFAVEPRTCDHWHFVGGQASHHVYGAICDKWRMLGSSSGALGPPVSSEHDLSCLTDSRGRPRHAQPRQTDFTFGDVVWNGTLAFEVHGGIAKLWRSMGGACGPAGFPLSDESGPPNARVSSFENGTIQWSPSSGAVFIPGIIDTGIHPISAH
jgi:hypothetical protein